MKRNITSAPGSDVPDRKDADVGNDPMLSSDDERRKKLKDDPFGAMVNGDVITNNKKYRITLILDSDDIKAVDERREKMWIQVPTPGGGSRAKRVSRSEFLLRCIYKVLYKENS